MATVEHCDRPERESRRTESAESVVRSAAAAAVLAEQPVGSTSPATRSWRSASLASSKENDLSWEHLDLVTVIARGHIVVAVEVE